LLGLVQVLEAVAGSEHLQPVLLIPENRKLLPNWVVVGVEELGYFSAEQFEIKVGANTLQACVLQR
jgi:hypothetical protein